MAGRPPKSLNNSKKHYTKEEKRQKEQAQNRIKQTKRPRRIIAPEILKTEGRKLFNSLAKELQELEIFTQLDVYNLAIFVNLLLEYEQCNKEIAEHGRILRFFDKNGNTYFVTNPAMKIQKDCLKEIKSIGSLLGMSVGDRLRYVQALQSEEIIEQVDKFQQAIIEARQATQTAPAPDFLEALKQLDL